MDFDILAALEDRSIEVETLADKDRMQIEYICINDIVPAKNNSNFYATDEITTLKESIRVEGVKQNLIVKKKNNEGKYELIAGERRWKACKNLYDEGIAERHNTGYIAGYKVYIGMKEYENRECDFALFDENGKIITELGKVKNSYSFDMSLTRGDRIVYAGKISKVQALTAFARMQTATGTIM